MGSRRREKGGAQDRIASRVWDVLRSLSVQPCAAGGASKWVYPTTDDRGRHAAELSYQRSAELSHLLSNRFQPESAVDHAIGSRRRAASCKEHHCRSDLLKFLRRASAFSS